MTTEEKHEKLATFIQREISRDPRRKIERDTPLISSGLVDSLSLFSVLVFIEDHLGVVIPDEAATAQSMNTLEKILILVDDYQTNLL